MQIGFYRRSHYPWSSEGRKNSWTIVIFWFMKLFYGHRSHWLALKKTLGWAKEHVLWPMIRWKRTVFSDEKIWYGYPGRFQPLLGWSPKWILILIDATTCWFFSSGIWFHVIVWSVGTVHQNHQNKFCALLCGFLNTLPPFAVETIGEGGIFSMTILAYPPAATLLGRSSP